MPTYKLEKYGLFGVVNRFNFVFPSLMMEVVVFFDDGDVGGKEEEGQTGEERKARQERNGG